MAALPSLEEKCGRYFRYRDFIECGETFHAIQPDNIPKSTKTYEALQELARKILDPICDQFGNIELTYGVSCPDLSRQITRRISPPLDQHASYEVNRNGILICPRGGAAVDFFCTGFNSLTVAQWIGQNCQHDRMYFYGIERPIHVSVGPENKRHIVLMRISENPNRRVPRKVSIEDFERLNEQDNLIASCSSTRGEQL
jgi:hypothetical protein